MNKKTEKKVTKMYCRCPYTSQNTEAAVIDILHIAVLKKFRKFTRKHMLSSAIFVKVQAFISM